MSDLDELDEFDELNDFNEFDTLMESCRKLDNDEIIESIYKVKQYFDKQSINVMHNGILKDFNELLDEFHTQSLEDIRTTGKSNFGERLMSIKNLN